jgi:hypothetical protein
MISYQGGSQIPIEPFRMGRLRRVRGRLDMLQTWFKTKLLEFSGSKTLGIV